MKAKLSGLLPWLPFFSSWFQFPSLRTTVRRHTTYQK